jgi:phospholipid/cholesterol/gamma-HCH transport system permease protein
LPHEARGDVPREEHAWSEPLPIRVFLPTKSLLEQVADMMILTGKTIVSALRPPYPYGTEFVQQFLFMLRLCWLPLTISTIAFG